MTDIGHHLALLLTGATAAHAGEAVITNIALCMVAAGIFGIVVKRLRQPLILGYVLAGVMIGPLGLKLITDESAIVTISQIGLILLLFMIGLEIDLKNMLSAGRLVSVTGVLQFPVSALLAFYAFRSFGMTTINSLYFALGTAISSTMIVVKLLYDKKDIDTLPGRITVGILVFQDIWAIIVLALQPNLKSPELAGIARTFGTGALLVVLALACSKYLLPRLFRIAAKTSELMVVLSLAWCFLVCLLASHPAVGLSMEMGALIAGIGLATFPYNLDVIARVITIRDFFITLFFVALGMRISMPSADIVRTVSSVIAVTFGTRIIGIFLVLYLLKSGLRTAILPALNLSQISEFSLVILSLGVGYGHIKPSLLNDLIWAFAILAVISTYIIEASHRIQKLISRILHRVGFKDLGSPTGPGVEIFSKRHIVVLGFYRIAAEFLEESMKSHQHLVDEMLVIDFNPETKKKMDALGVAYLYGDISNTDFLRHAEIRHARVVVSSISDSFLKGTSNRRLLKVLRKLCPQARIIVTAETKEEARHLYESGADFVLQPSHLAGAATVPAVDQALREGLDGMREEALAALADQGSFTQFKI